MYTLLFCPRHFSPCNQRCSLMAKHISNPLASIPSTSIKQVDIPTMHILKKETETKAQNKVILLFFLVCLFFHYFPFNSDLVYLDLCISLECIFYIKEILSMHQSIIFAQIKSYFEFSTLKAFWTSFTGSTYKLTSFCCDFVTDIIMDQLKCICVFRLLKVLFHYNSHQSFQLGLLFLAINHYLA